MQSDLDFYHRNKEIIMYPTTGYTPPEKKVCVRCLGPNPDTLYQLCPSCRAGDELELIFTDFEYLDLMRAVKVIRQEWMMQGFLPTMESEGYESGQETRRSLGL
jgi:hypothetical protein